MIREKLHQHLGSYGLELGEDPFARCLALACFSGGGSTSSSASTQQQETQSTTGATASNSPTVSAGGNVSVVSSDPQVAGSALTIAGEAIQAALGAGQQSTATVAQLAANQAQLSAQVQQAQQDTLNASLNASQSLAAAQGTGGASITAQSTNYLIWGGIAVAALAVFALILGRNK